jgi:hypothetical protein
MKCVLQKPVLQDVLPVMHRSDLDFMKPVAPLKVHPVSDRVLIPAETLACSAPSNNKSTYQNVLQYLKCAAPDFILCHFKVCGTSSRSVASFIQVSRR